MFRLLLLPFLPRRCAARLARMPLKRVYLLHAVGVAVLLAILALVDFLTARMETGRTVTGLILRDPFAQLVTVIVLAVAEVAFVVVAGVMTCWAGRVEPIRDTWRFALKASWMYVLHLWWVAPATVGFALYLERNPTGFPALGLARISAMTMSAVVVWSIVSYLRALTVDRRRGDAPSGSAADHATHHAKAGDVPFEHDNELLCETCGYRLVEASHSGNCPECGVAVVDSVSASSRRLINPDTGVLRLVVRALFQPEPFFRGLAVNQRSRSATICFAVSLVATGLAGFAGFVLGSFITGQSAPIRVLSVFVTPFACFCAWCFFMFASAIASGFGFGASGISGQNRFCASLMVVQWMSPIFVVWAFGGWLFMFGIAVVGRVGGLSLMSAWLATHALAGGLFCSVVWRRIKYVMYANR